MPNSTFTIESYQYDIARRSTYTEIITAMSRQIIDAINDIDKPDREYVSYPGGYIYKSDETDNQIRLPATREALFEVLEHLSQLLDV